MNWKKVLTVGLKVIATAGAAVAVWFGFSKALNNGNPEPIKNAEKVEEPQQPQGAKVINNLRKFQDTCGKLFGVAQALSSVGENLFRIFHGSNDYGYFPGSKSCGGGFTRVSSNVIEAQWTPGPNSAWGQQNKYCF